MRPRDRVEDLMFLGNLAAVIGMAASLIWSLV